MIIALMLAAATMGPVSACRPYTAGSNLAEGTRGGAELAAAWPLDWNRRGRLAQTELAGTELRRVVAALACTASWPGEEARVLALATPLFASKRHGAAAFAALDGLARSTTAPGPVRASAHGLRARLRHAVARVYDRV